MAFTGVLMLPAAAVLWWAGGYTESQFGPGGNAEFQHPGTYLKYAAAALAVIGTVLTIGAAAFAKKAGFGKYMLGAGCCAVALLSLWPVSDFVMVAPSWWIGAAALLGWVIFAAPYTALLLMLRKQ